MTLFIKAKELPKGIEVQVTKGLQVVGRFDTLKQAQEAYPQAIIAAGHCHKLGA